MLIVAKPFQTQPGMTSLCDTVEALAASPKMEVGKNISPNQPDVEVLAMLLRDFPVTKSAFNAARGDREWVMLQAGVVSVGPAGFSSVPYTASNAKKKDTTASLKRLYDDSVHTNKVVVYPYEKGKTNKDKGVRVDVMTEEDTEEEIAATAVLQTGMCFTQFMREESFNDDGRFFVSRPETETEVLKAGTMVFLQISASNIDQARKGNLFKVRKLKVSEDCATAIDKQLREKQFPRSRPEFEAVMEEMSQQKAVQKQRYTGGSKFFHTKPEASAFACEDTDSDSVVLAEFGGELDEVFCAKDLVLEATGCYDIQRAIKILTLALATGSLSLVVCSNQLSEGLLLNKRHEHEACWLCIDFVKMLDLDMVVKYQEVGASGSDFLYYADKNGDADVVVWCNRKVTVPTGSAMKRHIVYRLESEEKYSTGEVLNSTNLKTLLVDGAGGAHLPLHVYLMSDSSVGDERTAMTGIADDPDAKFDDHSMRLLSIQVQKSMAGRGAGKKRKRASFTDERDIGSV